MIIKLFSDEVNMSDKEVVVRLLIGFAIVIPFGLFLGHYLSR